MVLSKDRLEEMAECASVIYLDVDGVIWHTCDAMVKMLNKKYGGNYSGKDVTDWNFKSCYPNLTEEQVNELFRDDRLFDYVEPNKYIISFMERYRNKIIIITKAEYNNYCNKRKWFDRNGFKDIDIIPIPLNVSKGIINMGNNALFIDDSSKNLNESNAYYRVQFREYDDGVKREWIDGWDGDWING